MAGDGRKSTAGIWEQHGLLLLHGEKPGSGKATENLELQKLSHY